MGVHDPKNLTHLQKVLEENDLGKQDVVVISVNADCPDAESENLTNADEVLSACETKVFSKVVYVGEKAGKPAHLIAVPGKKVHELILLAASRLRSCRIVLSLSESQKVEEQEQEITLAWNRLPRPRPELQVEIMPDGDEAPWKFELNRQIVAASPADQELAHRLWRDLTDRDQDGRTLKETDILSIALQRFEEDWRAGDSRALHAIRQQIDRRRSDLEANAHPEKR